MPKSDEKGHAKVTLNQPAKTGVWREALQRLANSRLRTEVEIHAETLDYDFGHKPKVREISTGYLKAVFDNEIARLLREGQLRTIRGGRLEDSHLSQSQKTSFKQEVRELAFRPQHEILNLSITPERFMKPLIVLATRLYNPVRRSLSGPPLITAFPTAMPAPDG